MATPPTAEETRQAARAAKLAETEGAVNDVLERRKKILEDLGIAEAEAFNAKQKTLDLNTKILENQALVKKAIKDQLDLEKELAAKQKELAEWSGAMMKNEIVTANERIKAIKEELALKPGIIKSQNEAVLQSREQIELIREKTKMEKEYGDNLEDTLDKAEKASTRASDALADFASGLPVVGGSLRKVFDMKSKALKLGGQLEKLGGNYAQVGKGIKDFAGKISFSSMAIFAIVAAAGAMALQFDNLSKQIGSATGLGDKFNETLNKGYRQTILSGVSMKEYAGAVTSLANNFSGFNPTAYKTNIYLATTTSRLEKLGVSADSSSKLMDHFHRAMGLSQKAAADMTAQLVMLGRQVGITTSKMAADFAASAGVLARYGKDQIKVFKQLAAQVKGTGLEMGTLLGMAEKFDNFDTAADSAANLNAVLGTQLSTLELMNANEADRVKMIKEQVQASVGNFDSLDKFTKMHIAQAMGLKDVAEAQRLLNMSQAETAANAAKMQEQADIQKELAAATAELVPMMQKLKLIGMKLFMVFSPFISAFEGLFAFFDWAYEAMAPFIQGMGSAEEAAMALKLALIAIGLVLAVMFLPITGTTAAILGAVAAFGAWYDIIHKPGSKSMAGGIFDDMGASIGVFGKILLGAIAPVMLLVDGLKWLWEIIHKPGSLSMAGGLFDKTLGKSLSGLGSDAKAAGSDIDGLSGKMDGLHDTTHKGPGGGFDIQAMASLDTTAIAAGFNKIKSAVMELSNIKLDGFLAMHTDGSSSSFVMGSDGLIKSISEGKLIVDVKMPEMKLPEVLVKVFIGDKELKSLIRTEVKALGGAMG